MFLKRALKWVGGSFGVLVLAVLAYVGFIQATWEKDYSATPLPKISASQDPAVIARGEYVVHSVAHCSICHVPRSVTDNRAVGEHPPMAGGFKWELGPLGTLYSRNITPDKDTGIGSWTDEELARALKWCVGRDGKMLTFMTLAVPALADEDIQAIISYLRSTTPVKQVNKPNEPGLILKWLATKVGPDFRKQFVEPLKYQAPSETPSAARGEYLAKGAAWCAGCHTPFNLSDMTLAGPMFSGSSEAEPDHDDPTMVFRIPNLTSDPETGLLATWDEGHFIARFRAGRAIHGSKMPWEAYREMTDADLKSIFMYLRSVPPTKHYIGPTYRKASEDPTKDAPPGRASL
jgi:mono/diheme cytochrome c family protein